MNTKNIFNYPMDRGSIKKRTVVSGVSLGLMLVLTIISFIGVKQGWLKMEPTRRGVSFSPVRETEPVSDSIDPTVELDVIADETAAEPEPAAKQCPACGEIVALEAVSCPGCGNVEGDFAPQVTCPVCGSLHDLDDPQCPFCAERSGF